MIDFYEIYAAKSFLLFNAISGHSIIPGVVKYLRHQNVLLLKFKFIVQHNCGMNNFNVSCKEGTCQMKIITLFC